MQYNKLGLTGLEVSHIGLGTVELGLPYEIGLPPPPPDEDCLSLLRQALEAGITYFDTAAAYGRSEELVGRAFAHLGQKPVLATKVNLHDDPANPPLEGENLAQHMAASIDRSRRLLKVETLDLLQIHNAAPQYITADLLEIMQRHVQLGHVRYWGASTYGPQAALGILRQADHFSTLQVAYNILDQSPVPHVFKKSEETQTGLVLRSVFLKGLLTHRFCDETLPPHLAPLQRTVEHLQNTLSNFDLTLSEAAFRFATYCPQAHITLFGTTKIDELRDNVATYDAGPLPQEVLAAIEKIEIEDPSLLSPSSWGF
ncbi:MAG: hypothetical protein GKR89_09620 [Candidatus Latescibacteria bacterium]|nr:hypothetical protein [Candidatus Latescibacterota bacterium]